MCERTTIIDGRAVSACAAAIARAERAEVVRVVDVLDVPALRLEPRAAVLGGERDRGRAVDRDPVVVVEVDELAEPELARDRRGLVRDALHHVAVGADRVDAVVDDRVARPVEEVAEEPLRDRHPDAVREALPERPGRRLDARRVTALGVAGRRRAPLPEALELVEREVVPGEVERRVLEDARVAGAEHEPVAVGPVRIGRRVPHRLGVEQVRERRERHRRARMAGVRLLHGVHRERPDRVDRELFDVGARHGPRQYPPMAVLVASQLRKEISGSPLFDGVSFKVERRDRLALAGPNGAGKTTLLRMLAGEASFESGELAFEKGARVALHDQRPPLERGLTLREYVLSRRARPRRVSRTSCASSSRRWPAARTIPATLARLLGDAGAARARGRLRLARPRDVGRPRARLRRRAPRPAARDVLRRRAHARVARARARRRPRPAAARRADEPPRRREPRVARARAAEPRRRRDPRRARPLVPRGGHDRDARARRRAGDVLPRPVARLAAREGGADAARAEGGRRGVEDDIERLERFVERFRAKKAKAKQAQAKLTQIQRLRKERAAAADEVALLSRRRADARLRVPQAGAERADGRRGRRG